MKMVVGNVYEPLRARVLPCSAGAIAGRGCGELIWRMVLAIWQCHALQTQAYMMWVDLSKCFMTFSRAVGQHTQKRRGVPAAVRKAVWNLYARPRGRFDSAFGCCPEFTILRGYLQGTLEAPDLCIGDMNVLCEIMDLKVVGIRWWDGGMEGSYTQYRRFLSMMGAPSRGRLKCSAGQVSFGRCGPLSMERTLTSMSMPLAEPAPPKRP